MYPLWQAAALEAKKKGEIEEAKEYLRNCKGLTGLIEASRGGLPVNMATVRRLFCPAKMQMIRSQNSNITLFGTGLHCHH